MKRPAAALAKKPAANITEELEDTEKDVDSEPPTKKSATLLKRPAAQDAASSKATPPLDSQKDSGEDTKDISQPSAAMEFRAATRLVQKKQRELTKLEEEKSRLSAKMKANGVATRKVQRELEELDADAKSKGRAVSRIKASKRAAQRVRLADRAAKISARASAVVKSAKKRMGSAVPAMQAAKERLEAAESEKSRLQAAVKEAEQKCKALKAKGQYVPDWDDCSDWQFSHRNAPLPPGVLAHRTWHQAKEALKKKEPEWKKVAKLASEKEAKYQALQEKSKDAQRKRKEAETLLTETKGKAKK